MANLEIKNPTLTEYGIKSMYNLVSLDYFQTSIQRLYRINGGEWQEYTDKVRLEIGDKLEAKGIDKYGIETSFLTQQFQYGNALGLEAYDGNENTYVEAVNATANKYINVSKELWNQKIYVKMSGALAGNITLNADLIFIKEDGTEISKIQSGRGALSGEYQIPTGTSKIKIQLSYFSDQYGKARIYEIKLCTKPVANLEIKNPTLTEYGIKSMYNLVSLDYFQTSIQRLYRINGGEWQEYTDKVRLEIGDKLEAKGIDKYGIETSFLTQQFQYGNALGLEAYDGNENTYVEAVNATANKYINVSKELWNQKIYVKMSGALAGNITLNADLIFIKRRWNRD